MLRFPGRGFNSLRPTARLCVFLLALLALLGLTGCPPFPDPEIQISHYDPFRAYEGTTYFEAAYFFPGYFAVDMEGNILWYRSNAISIAGDGAGMSMMADGKILAMPEMVPTIFDPQEDTILWEHFEHRTHHSIIESPWGTVLFLVQEDVEHNHEPWGTCRVLGDKIVEINLEHETLWEWTLADHVDPLLHHRPEMCSLGFGRGDWSHSNTVKAYSNYHYNGRFHAILVLLARNLHTFYVIDYPSGDILWSCGEHGTLGRSEPPDPLLFDEAHGVEMLANNHFLLFDNGVRRTPLRSRALELAIDPEAGTATTHWEWTDPVDWMRDTWMGDATRLPNGNTLVTHVLRGRLVEVTLSGDKVWQMDLRHRDRPLAEGLNTIYTGFRVSD